MENQLSREAEKDLALAFGMALACRTAAETLNDLAESSQLAREEGFADGAIMARWRANTGPDVTNFDGCG